MSIFSRRAVFALLTLALVLTALTLLIGWRFRIDMQQVRDRAAQGSMLLQTRCGPSTTKRPAPACRCWPYTAAAAGMTRAWRLPAPCQNKASG